MGQTYYCVMNGEPFGPVTLEEMRHMVVEHLIGPEDLAMRADMTDWVQASELPELWINPAIANWAEPGPVVPLGKQFAYSGHSYLGVACVSPRAFYLLRVKTRVDDSAGIPLSPAGLLTGLVASALSADTPLDNGDNRRSCTLGEFSDDVQLRLDPMGRLYRTTPVVIIPRDLVHKVRLRVNNVILVEARSEAFYITIPFFSVLRVRSALRDLRWILNRFVYPEERVLPNA